MAKDKMKALIINCSPVRTGATAELVKLVSEQLSNKYSIATCYYVCSLLYTAPASVAGADLSWAV